MSMYEFEPAEIALDPIRIGSAWEWEIELAIQEEDGGPEEPLDLTGAEARLQVRRTPTDAVPLISLTHTSGITLTGACVKARTASGITAQIRGVTGSAYWDLQIKLAGGDWWTPAAGSVEIRRGISR